MVPPFRFAGGLLGIRALLARPGSGRAVEAAPRGVVGELLDGPEYGPLEGPREQQPRPADVAMLRVRRLLLIDHAPDLVEHLLAEDAGEQPRGDRQRGEEQLGHSGCIPDGGSASQLPCARYVASRLTSNVRGAKQRHTRARPTTRRRPVSGSRRRTKCLTVPQYV